MLTLSSRRLIGLLLLASASIASPARAGVLWYNGDYDNRDSLDNFAKVPVNTGKGYVLTTSLVYDNFVVPTGQIWTLSSVFSNDQIAYGATATTATWQILSGVSSGSGGTTVASGDTAATVTAIAPVAGNYYGDPEYQVSAAVTGVTLTAGTYFLAVAPDSVGYYGDQSYIETTSGANAIGVIQGNDGNSYVTNNYPPSGPDSFNFTPTTTALAGDGDGSLIDFSMGVAGAATTVVPEPSSVALLAIGLAGALAWSRRRRVPAVA